MAQLPQVAVVLSFEGPDRYAMVGGLATRAVQLCDALADCDIETTLIFIGDPALPAVETPRNFLEYRRWSQWISAFHPGGVYDGEWGKVNDYTSSVSSFIASDIVERAARARKRVLVMAEDWQTAGAAIALDARLRELGLRDRVSILWNANNTYGFERIAWPQLDAAAQITAVSRYMKFELATYGVEALVIPNGISERVLAGPSSDLVRRAAQMATRRPLFVKVGRYDADKRWLQAIDAFAIVRRRFSDAMLVVRGGKEPYGERVRARAAGAGLRIEPYSGPISLDGSFANVLAGSAGILELHSFVPDDVLHSLYAVADAVLANSGKEPFGYVGLEVMAAGGVAVCGSTGEDYAEPFVNAIVCDTGEGRELAAYLEAMLAEPALSSSLRANGRETAQRYAWPRVLDIIARKLLVAVA